MTKNLLLIFISIFLQSLNDFSFCEAAEFICPAAKTIRPCACSVNDEEGPGQGLGMLVCEGSKVTQASIDSAVLAVRNAAGLSPSDWLDLHSIDIQYTELSSLDLAPFYKIHLDALSIFGNMRLQSLQGSSSSGGGGATNTNSRSSLNENEGQIKTKTLSITYNKLNDQGFGNIFTLFSSQSLTHLDLNNNEISGGQYKIFKLQRGSDNDKGNEGAGATIEFLPGLASLGQLERLNVNENQVRKVAGGQFKGNSQLRYLSLIDNQMEEVGEGAFDGGNFEQQPVVSRGSRSAGAGFEIFLTNNQLNENTFSANNGLQHRAGPVSLDLRDNEFATLPQETFSPFLFKNDKNSLTMYRNRCVCDQKVKWLKEKRAELEERVTGVVCRNDPERNVFNTDLI